MFLNPQQTKAEMEYPEHEKLKAVSDKSHLLGEFLEWLETEKGIILSIWSDERLHPAIEQSTTQALLAEYFDIDLMKIQLEKDDMLAEMRKANNTQRD